MASSWIWPWLETPGSQNHLGRTACTGLLVFIVSPPPPPPEHPPQMPGTMAGAPSHQQQKPVSRNSLVLPEGGQHGQNQAPQDNQEPREEGRRKLSSVQSWTAPRLDWEGLSQEEAVTPSDPGMCFPHYPMRAHDTPVRQAGITAPVKGNRAERG